MTDADLQEIANRTGEPIEIVRELNDAIEACEDEGPMMARAERRGGAVEAGMDAWSDIVAVPVAEDRIANALEDAIDTAVRVRVDADLTQAAHDARPGVMVKTAELRAMIEAAFAAAGFVVEK